VVSIDILGPLISTTDGNRFILVMTDRFSKLTRTAPLRRITTVTVTSAFLSGWIAAYGPPDYVLSDQGKQMDNPFFRAVMKMLGVQCKYTTPYHPQTNGQVERYNRTLLNQLRCFCEEHPRLWDRLLPVLSLAYNACPHCATGLAPFDLLIPRRMPNLTVEELAGGTFLKGTADGSQLMVKRAIINGLKKAIHAVRDTLTRYQARYKRAWDGKVRPKNKDLVVGDFVCLRSHRGGHKLSPKALRPFKILDKDGTFFVIDQGEGEGRVNSDHVTATPPPGIGPGPATAPPDPIALTGGG